MPDASDVRNWPVCPRCSGGIDSLRYGRVLKNSNHCILQHNIARYLSGHLSNAEKMLSGTQSALQEAITEVVHSFGATNLPAPTETTRRALLERINTALATNRDCPTSLDIVENLSKFHGFPPRHTRAWRKAGQQDLRTIPVGIWRSMLGGNSAQTTDPAQQRLQDLAAKVAHVCIGHPRPRSSDRFTVEAFWITIEILVMLGLATSKACEDFQQRNAPGANVTHWENVAGFLLLRASKDTETAFRLADESKSQNKAIICRRLILQAQYEHAAHKCRVAVRNGSLLNREIQEEYLSMCNRSIERIQDLQTSVPRDYQRRVQRSLIVGSTAMKVKWVQDHFELPAQTILKAWNKLARAIQNDMAEWRRDDNGEQLVLWRPVVQEQAASNRTSHTQRFYQCIRGHPYTRGEVSLDPVTQVVEKSYD
ncbi:hypothetical protein OPQ81_007324 [Rhizoctonia solani]|nr:hypothetical protein OPQ81_007324 [Rhizoctonia solani]